MSLLPRRAPSGQVAAVNALADTTFVLACGRSEGIIGGPPTISGRIVALSVDTLNSWG